MKKFEFDKQFILSRSPSNAPPVRFLVGSVQRSATLHSGLSLAIRNIISSINDDLPAPPVPVKPITGTFSEESLVLHFSKYFSNTSSSAVSANVSSNETFPLSSGVFVDFNLDNLDFLIKST
ncbi:MAG: Uncharacterised protein [Methanobacteriota archaeon]|nr:MAG: Uncharacterised protein [Euryarchaeota archaeon]